MSVKIRLRRTGRKKQPLYRIVIADSRSPRDGKFIEVIGQYAPRQGELALNLKTERVNYWLDSGAQPTDTVRSLLRKAGVLKTRHEQRLGRKLTATAIPVAQASEETEAPQGDASGGEAGGRRGRVGLRHPLVPPPTDLRIVGRVRKAHGTRGDHVVEPIT